MAVFDELLEWEHRGWAALCDGTGADFYGTLMTEDGVMVIVGGTVLDRTAVMASLRHAPPWRTYRVTDERLVTAGADAATLVYTGRAWRDGDEPGLAATMATHYVRREGRWRLAVYQQTPLTPVG